MKSKLIVLCLNICAVLGWGAAAAASDFKLPPYQKLKTAQGIELFLMPQSEVPLLHISVGVRGGGSLDDPQSYGLAALTAAALPLGTKSYKKSDLEAQLDFLGADLSLVAHDDFTSIELSLASDDAKKLLPLLAEVIKAPTFPEKEFVKLKERTISDLKKRRESPNQLAEQYFERLVYRDHIYAHPLLGSPLSVSRITRSKVLAFYEETFRPDRMAISVTGKFDPKEMTRLIEDAFGSWTFAARALPLVTSGPEGSAPTPEVLLVNKSDATETTFRIGGLGIPRASSDWVPLQVINTILGGRFTSMLNEELRVKTGLTYGAKSRFDGLRWGGSFAISSFTANENSFKAIDLALATYKSFLEKGFDQETLDSAKSYVKGQFPPNYETLDHLATYLIEKWALGIPEDRIDHYEKEVDALTLERSRELVKKYFPQKLDILLIGKAVDLAGGAAKYGRVIRAEIDRIDDAPLSK